MKPPTPAAVRLLATANKISHELNVEFISIDILLMALIRMDHGVSGLLLRNAGITEEAVGTMLDYQFITSGGQGLSRKTETAPSAPAPSASTSYPRAGATTPLATSEPTVEDPSLAEPPRQDHPGTPQETPAPQNRRHIPLEEIIAMQVRAKWLLEYHQSLLTARPQDLSPLDVAYIQQTSGDTAGRNLWRSQASFPAMPVSPAPAAPLPPAPESQAPVANLWMVPCPECGLRHLPPQAL